MAAPWKYPVVHKVGWSDAQHRAGRGRPGENKNTVRLRYPDHWITAQITLHIQTAKHTPLRDPRVMGHLYTMCALLYLSQKKRLSPAWPASNTKWNSLSISHVIFSLDLHKDQCCCITHRQVYSDFLLGISSTMLHRKQCTCTENRDGTDLGILSCITIGISASWEMLPHVTWVLITARSSCCLVFSSGTTAFQISWTDPDLLFSSLALCDGNLARSGRPAAGGFLCCLSGRLKSHFVESCWTTIWRSNGESPFLLGREGPWVATMQFLLCWSLGHCIRHALVWALWEMTPVRGSRLFNTLKACC